MWIESSLFVMEKNENCQDNKRMTTLTKKKKHIRDFKEH